MTNKKILSILFLIITIFVYPKVSLAYYCADEEKECAIDVQNGIKGDNHNLLDWNNNYYNASSGYYTNVKLDYYGKYRNPQNKYVLGYKKLNESNYSIDSLSYGYSNDYLLFTYSAKFINTLADAKWFQIFCLDPHLNFMPGVMKDYDKLFLNDAYDRALIAIGQYNIKNRTDYFATMIALRAYKAYKMNENITKENTSYYAYYNTAKSIIENNYSITWQNWPKQEEKNANGLYVNDANDTVNKQRLDQVQIMIKKAAEAENYPDKIWYPNYNKTKNQVHYNEDNTYNIDIEYKINTPEISTHNLEEIKNNLGGNITYYINKDSEESIIKIVGTTKVDPINVNIKVKQNDKRTPQNFRRYHYTSDAYQEMFAIVQAEYDLINDPIIFNNNVSKNDVCDITVKDHICNKDNDDYSYTFYVGNKNITACVLDSIDIAKTTNNGNTAYQKYSNDYCQIACAENFKITMPTKKYAKAGTYFEYKENEIEINSNRLCSSKVDYPKFYNDLFNNSNKEQEIANLNMNFDNRAIKDSDTFEVKTKGTDYIGGLNQQVKDYTKLVEYFTSLNTESKYLEKDGDCIPNTGCNQYYTIYYQNVGGKEFSCSSENDDCSKKKMAESFALKLTEASAALEASTQARLNIIKKVNACSENVTNDILHDNPDISYEYKEPYTLDLFRSIPERSINNNIDLYCKNIKFDEENNTFNCTENVSQEKQSINDIYNCNDECKIYKINYRAKMKSSIKNYESTTNFYTKIPSGEI